MFLRRADENVINAAVATAVSEIGGVKTIPDVDAVKNRAEGILARNQFKVEKGAVEDAIMTRHFNNSKK